MAWARVLLMGLVVLFFGSSMAAAAKRVALVIGNSSYENLTPLLTPVHDAGDLAVALQGLGFLVEHKTDLSAGETHHVVDQFTRQYKNADIALFYFAGHSLVFKGEKHLLPVDVRLDVSRAEPAETLSMGELYDSFARMKNLTVLLIDAARPNRFEPLLAGKFGSESVQRWPFNIRVYGQSVLNFSTSKGQYASDGSGRNSSFADAVVRQLAQETIEFPWVFREIASAVSVSTNGAQTPYYIGSQTPGYRFQRTTLADGSTKVTVHSQSGTETVAQVPSPPKVENQCRLNPDKCGKHLDVCEQAPGLCPTLLSQTVDAANQPRDKQIVSLLAASVSRTGQTRYHELAVRVPENHKTGSIEDPDSWYYWTINIAKPASDKQTYFQFIEPKPLTKNEFLALIRLRDRTTGLVFVHGYNNSLKEAAFRAAQISWDTNYDRHGELFLFRWHSSDSAVAYKYDRDSIAIARRPFIEFLKLLQEQTQLKQIHVLAHSMGNRLVLDALASYSPLLLKRPIGELIMAHPDVDQDLYKHLITQVDAFTQGMTLYTSKIDRALWLSEKTGFAKTAGNSIERNSDIHALVDTIDISELASGLFSSAHSTFATNRTILEDLVELIVQRTRPPHKRTRQLELVQAQSGEPGYWRFPR